MENTALIVWSFWKETAGVAAPGILYLGSSNLRKIFQYKYMIGTGKTLWYKSLEKKKEFRIGGHEMQQSWGNPSSLVSCEIFDQVSNLLSWKGACFPRQSTVWPYLIFINFLKQTVKLFVGLKSFSFLANVFPEEIVNSLFSVLRLKASGGKWPQFPSPLSKRCYE